MPGNDRPVVLNGAEGRVRPSDGPRRLLDKDGAARYLAASVDTVERLIQAGELPVVRLPVERTQTGGARVGVCRRVHLDVRDLDALIERSKEGRRSAEMKGQHL